MLGLPTQTCNVCIYLGLCLLHPPSLVTFSLLISYVSFSISAQYLISFAARVDSVFISVSTCSLLVYRNEIDFCVLIWYHTLNSLVVVLGFLFVPSLLDSLGRSMQKTTSSANRDGFVSFSAICMPAINFSCFIAAAGTSSTMLKRDRKADTLALLPELGRNTRSLWLLSTTQL